MDLSTNYLGFHLKNPLVAAASPMSRQVESVRAMEDAGIAAVVVYSLFEEQIRHSELVHEHFDHFGANSYHESLSYKPALDYLPRGPEIYVEHVAEIKRSVEIPVIASLNGSSPGGWTSFARMLQEAGADAIELNIYNIATDPELSSAEVENRYEEIVAGVKASVNIPVAVKLSPYFTSLAHFARRLEGLGVEGLVLFNRFYQPDIDLEELEVRPSLSFSSSHEMRLPLRWIAVLDAIVQTDLAASTGVYTHLDVLKLLMAGANVTMLCAALLRDGPRATTRLLTDIAAWMEEHEYDSVRQMQGSMNHSACDNPAQFERANYMAALHEYR